MYNYMRRIESEGTSSISIESEDSCQPHNPQERGTLGP